MLPASPRRRAAPRGAVTPWERRRPSLAGRPCDRLRCRVLEKSLSRAAASSLRGGPAGGPVGGASRVLARGRAVDEARRGSPLPAAPRTLVATSGVRGVSPWRRPSPLGWSGGQSERAGAVLQCEPSGGRERGGSLSSAWRRWRVSSSVAGASPPRGSLRPRAWTLWGGQTGGRDELTGTGRPCVSTRGVVEDPALRVTLPRRWGSLAGGGESLRQRRPASVERRRDRLRLELREEALDRESAGGPPAD